MITTLAGTPACRLGLSAHPAQDSGACIPRAFARGVNYFFFYGAGYGEFVCGLGKLIRTKRNEIIVATGSGARKRGTLQAARRKIVAALGIDVLDVFFAEYIHPGDDLDAIFGDDGVLDQLQEWKSNGWIRMVGATVHDRKLAERLARDQRVDLLMHRFNMAHRKATRSVFSAAQHCRTPVIAFTATRWGTLLQPHSNWPHDPPTAADCYRYCLAHPAVELVLTSPSTMAELNENLAVLDSKKMNRRELVHWERFGDLIHGLGSDSFETDWP